MSSSGLYRQEVKTRLEVGGTDIFHRVTIVTLARSLLRQITFIFYPLVFSIPVCTHQTIHTKYMFPLYCNYLELVNPR